MTTSGPSGSDATRSPRAPDASPDAGSPERWLRRRYEGYCRAQARELLDLLPRDAVRPLYRRARSAGGGDARPDLEDPLAVLVEYCRRILPLPPFAVWREDVRRHPDAYRDRDDPRWVREPVTVDVRALEVATGRWFASLDVRSDGGIWRGCVTFRRPDEARAYSTGEIFRESGVEAIRERFLEYDDRTLAAFLRSALP